MNVMGRYLEQIVDPTLDDFARNPTSVRHAFLACVAAYHAIDRGWKSAGNLKKDWHQLSPEFLIVDMVAHHFKHVKSDIEKAPNPPGFIPVSFLVFGAADSDESAGSDVEERMETRNLYFVVLDAVKFLHEQAINQDKA